MIPEVFDFSTIPSLRPEARQKLTEIRPATIGQAARISGVSPADISILMVWLKRCGGIKNGDEAPVDADDCSACEAELDE